MTTKIGDILLKAKVIDQLQLRSALAPQSQWGGRLPAVIVEKRFARADVVVAAISKALGLPRVDLTKVEKDSAALAKVDATFCQENAVFPCALKDGGKTLWVAMADPTDIPTVDALALKTRARIKPVVSGEAEIMAAIDLHYLGRESAPAGRQAFGSIAPPELDEAEDSVVKVVDMAGHTLVKNHNDVKAAEAAEKPPPPIGPPSTTSSALDDLLGLAQPATLSPQDLQRIQLIQDQQEKGARILRTVLELCLEKGYFRIDDYRQKLGR